MADPVSIIGLVFQIGDIVRRVFEYGKGVKESKAEIRTLCEELFALKGVLEHLQQRSESMQDIDEDDGIIRFMDSVEFLDMARSTKEFLDSLLSRLTVPTDKLHRAVKALTWPLNRREITTHIERITRVKTWFVMTMMSDTLDLSKETFREVHELKLLLLRDHEFRTFERQEKARKELTDWLAPANPSDAHTRAFNKWQIGTGSWFVKGPFDEWFTSDFPSMLWLRGKSGAGKTTLL